MVSRGQSHPRATRHPVTRLHRRLLDHSNEGFSNWEFMSVHSWGEKAEGVWTLEIQDVPAQVRDPDKQGQWPWERLPALVTPGLPGSCCSVSGHSLSPHFYEGKIPFFRCRVWLNGFSTSTVSYTVTAAPDPGPLSSPQRDAPEPPGSHARGPGNP